MAREYVRAQLASLSVEHDQLLQKVPTIPDLQCAWMLLLCCCAARANYILRVVHPDLTAMFVAHHDASLRRCLSQLLGVDPSSVYWDLASLPSSLGGLGLRSATVTSRPAYWSSWADCLGMVQQRHPAVSRRIVHALNAHHPAFHLAGVRASGAHLAAPGFVAPSWGELADGIRPENLCWKWTGNRVSLVMVGNGPLLCQSTADRLRTASDHVCPCLSKLCSDLKEDRCQVSHSLVSPPLRCLVSIPPPSACCFAASGSLLPRVPAGVAVSVMSLATTGRVAQRQGPRDVGGSLWRARRHVCVRRPAPGSRQMSW